MTAQMENNYVNKIEKLLFLLYHCPQKKHVGICFRREWQDVLKTDEYFGLHESKSPKKEKKA